MIAYIVKGLGIECELEMERALLRTEAFEAVNFINFPKLLSGHESLPDFKKGDCFVIPGGFSYSDHFGAGKLLAIKFRELKILDLLDQKQVNILGICNGFQIMCQTGCFGKGIELHRNRPIGFKNRWVSLQSPWGECCLPVRHGEGRLIVDSNSLPKTTKKILSYIDPDFNNASFENIAGLVAFKNEAWRIGMMPHPEIALSKMDHPDRFGTDHFEQHRSKLYAEEGDGLQLLKSIFDSEKFKSAGGTI